MPKSAQGAEISHFPNGFCSSGALLEAEQCPFLGRCNHRLVSAPPEQGRTSCVWNISLLPQLYSLGIKGNLRLIISAPHFCGSRVLQVLNGMFNSNLWAAGSNSLMGSQLCSGPGSGHVESLKTL